LSFYQHFYKVKSGIIYLKKFFLTSKSSAAHGDADGTRLSGPGGPEDALLAALHVGFHPARDGVVQRHGRLFRVLDLIGEKSSFGDLDELFEFRRWHLQILAGDSLGVTLRVEFSLRLSDDASERPSAELLERDGIEHEEWSVGLSRHYEFGFVVRRTGGVRLVWYRVEHDEHLLGTGAEFEAVGGEDGVVAVVGDFTGTFERHALHLGAEVVDVAEDGLAASEGVHVGGLVDAFASESNERVSDVEFSLSSEVLVEVEHSCCRG